MGCRQNTHCYILYKHSFVASTIVENKINIWLANFKSAETEQRHSTPSGGS